MPRKPIRSETLVWYEVAKLGELPEGRVASVSCGTHMLCLTHYQGQYGALDNACPHQGGPLGEGSIEKGWLRCPWHGWDYDPLTGQSPGGYDDGVESHPVEIRDGAVWVGLPEPDDRPATISDRMVETMVEWGVRWVFGMVGHSNLGLADAIRRRTQRDDGLLRYVGIRHEGAAAFAASAYGKLTGRPAAALAIAGPGATNLLTGLWDAHVDHAPALALTGQVQTQVLGRGAFQELPLAKVFAEVARFSHPVLRSSNHVELMNLACKHALLEPGVAHLIFPDEIQNLPAATEARAGSPEGRMPRMEIAPDERSLTDAIACLRAARRPVIIVGYGARDDMPAILELAERLHAPVLTTFKAKGQVSDFHPLGAGVLGRSGTPIASWFMNEADLLLVLGSSFSNHTGISAKHPIIQIDSDRTALARFHPVTVPVWGAIGPTIARLLAAELGDKVDQRDEVAARWAIWRAEKQSRRGDDRQRGVSSAALFDALSRLVPADAIIPVDVGNNTYSFGRYFECRAQRILMSGYLGSIGFGLPAAMGAWAATQEPGPWHGRKVVSISGDGGFAQYMAELTTLAKYGMNITHVLLDNGELGKISKEQRAGHWPVWETALHNPNFCEFARLCSVTGFAIERAEQLDELLGEALACEGPSLVHVHADGTLI
jgi:pyruvate oxidase